MLPLQTGSEDSFLYDALNAKPHYLNVTVANTAFFVLDAINFLELFVGGKRHSVQ